MIIRMSFIILGWQACCSAGREAIEEGAGTVEYNAAVTNCSYQDNTSDCYPKLADFLEEFTNHYTHSEVYFLLQDDGPRELTAAGLMLMKRSPGRCIRFVQTTREGPPPRLPSPVYDKPVFVTTVSVLQDLSRSQGWSVGEDARHVAWLILSRDLRPVLTKDYYFPLDNLLTFAVWKELCDRKIVELWEVYQAGPGLPYRSAKVGFWTVPGSRSAENALCQEDPADGPAKKDILGDGGEEAGAGGDEEEERFFPSDNIASRRRNLTGLHIRCLTESWEPFTHNTDLDDGAVRIGGYMGDNFQFMSDILNFTYTCRHAPDGYFGDFKNGSWSGMVGELIADRGDVIVSALDNTYQRSQYIDFCLPSGSIIYVMVIRRPESNMWSSFTRQLHRHTWFTVLAFVVLSPALYHLVATRSPCHAPPPSLLRYRKVPPSFFDSWFAVNTLFLNQGDLQVTGASIRVCLLSVVLTAWLIIVFYTSVLMSSLAVPILSPPFKDMRGLLMAGTHMLGLQEGNSEVERMRTSQDPVLQKVWSDIVLSDPNNLVPSANDGVLRVLSDRFAFLMDLEYFAYHRGSDCRLFPLPDHIFTYGAGMAVQKDSPLRLVFNDQILQQHVTGITDRNRKRHLPSPPLCIPDAPTALGLNTLLTSFLLLAAAIVTALLLLVLEVVHNRCFKRTEAAGTPCDT
ncbi:glutamate receptor ionotropic, kainate glr-3-like [Penaeus chinensis]|uniref:glutamate receptor ionotropic, kainate glr-3-like n=1 Tax=Penaeus chinensis TaxID=139456 RepID=UPI001FB83206|nr:glutamate receptor ionotropic, kainate glr-3-like [Penaeus chinensis]